MSTLPEEKQPAINPIDPDKVAENPHLLPYSHSVGGVVIKPVDRGKVKGRAIQSMYEQTDRQLDQIKQQIELLAKQAKSLQERVQVSEAIYQAEMGFEPLVGKTYHLYQRDNGNYVLSLLSPAEWGGNPPFTFIASAMLLADHTWEVSD